VRRQSKKPASTLEHRLSGYALAASAAGVGLLALAQPAEAKIVYTPTHHVIAHGGSFNLDLNHDGIIDFKLRNTFWSNTSTGYSRLFVKPAAGNGADGRKGLHSFAFALQAGTKVGPGDDFPGTQMLSFGAGPGGIYYSGYWLNVNNRYLGLKFKIKGQNHFGWARLSVHVDQHPYQIAATITGYAYETIPNKAIITGKTKGPDVITEPASLGALAAGAKGLHTWRQK
jgi:hypothetical protein